MEWVKLGDIAEIRKGKKLDQCEEGINAVRYIQIEDLRHNDEMKFTCDPKSVMANSEDVLIAWDGANAGTISFDLEGAIGSTISKISIKEKKKNELLPQYLGIFLQSKEDYLRQTTTGATIPHINKQALVQLAVPLFPLEIQNRLIELNNSLIGLIAKRREQIDALDALVKSLFIEISEQNEGELVQLKKVASIEANTVDNFVPFSEDYYLGVEDIEKETGNILKMVRVKDAEIKSSKNRFTREAILYSKIRPYLNKVALPNFDGLASTDVFPIMCGEKINKYYLLNVLRSEKFVLYATLNSSGANIPRVNRKTVENYTFTLPPIALQNRFADYVTAIEAQKESLRASLTELETLFDALMQAAFSGHLNQSY